MKRFGGLVLASLTSVMASHAAEVTRIATAFEDKTPFQMYIDAMYVHYQENATLARTWHSGGDLVSLPELRYQLATNRLDLDAHIGIYKDLELHYGLPIVLLSQEHWQYSSSTSAAASTIQNNCLNADGTLTNPSCPTTGAGATPLFPVTNQSYRSGLGDMRFGLAWAAFNQSKDDTKPTWVLGFDWQAPTATQLDPTVRTTLKAPGAVGDREHYYHFYTALSRKYGPAEPYFKVEYTAPAQGPGYYTNCSHATAANAAEPLNCYLGPWTRSETGIHSPQTADVMFGTELYAFESDGSRLGLDLRGVINYFGPGRYYNEMSYLMGKLLSSSDYLQVGGRVGVLLQLASWVYFKAAGELLYNTDHLVTAESPGKDLNGNGSVTMTPGSLDINPNYDYRVDAPGRQFRATDEFVFRFDIDMSLVF